MIVKVFMNENLLIELYKFLHNSTSIIIVGAVILSVYKLLKAFRKGSAGGIKGQLLLTTMVIVGALILFALRDWQFFWF